MSTTGRAAVLAVFLAALAAAGDARAAGKDIHIPAGRSVGFNWYVNDGAGFRWDISSNGQVSDGTNDAYDGGMQLRLGGTYFSNSGAGRLAKDGREVEIGPWKRGSVQVYRRIYVDAKLGYCRWIDIFENTTQAAQTVSVQYYTNLGTTIRRVWMTSGKAEPTEKDWGAVTGSTSSSSRPAVVHVFASRGARVRPRFRWTRNSDSVYYDFTLRVPAGKAVALCVFQAQRRPFEQATKFLKDFKPRAELAKVPAPLRRILVNMGGATLMLGNLDLPRHEKHDLAVLRNENELLGTILNERFEVETFFGRLDLPATRVVGVNIPTPDDPHTQVILVDGQVVAGRLLNAPVRIRLTNGNEMALPPAKLAAATFALSPEKPGEIKLTRPTVVLRSGQRLAFRAEDLDGTFQTQYGTVELNAEDLREIHFDTPDGGLHRAVFRNGSVLSGLLTAGRLELRLDLGPTLSIRRQVAARCLFPGEEVAPEGLVELTLRNDDVLRGRIDQDALTVATQFGQVRLAPEEIAELTAPPEGTLGQVQIKLHSGTSVTGMLVGRTLAFEITPGPRLEVFLGHVVKMTCPKPPTTAPATAPAPPPDSPPGESPGSASPPPPEPPAPAPADRTEVERAKRMLLEAIRQRQQAVKARAEDARRRAARPRTRPAGSAPTTAPAAPPSRPRT